MKTFILTALCAVTLTAQAQEAKRDTIDKYIIDNQFIGNFDGSQLEGKRITTYTIDYKESGNVVVKNHVIYTSDKAEKSVIIEGDANGPLIVSKVLGSLIIVDGKESSAEGMAMIKSEDIVSVNVCEPGSEIAKSYGEKGRNGVIFVTTKATSVTKVVEPLIIVDGKVTSLEEFNKMKPKSEAEYVEKFASITVLKPESAVKIWGSKGSNGVLVVETKAAQQKK